MLMFRTLKRHVNSPLKIQALILVVVQHFSFIVQSDEKEFFTSEEKEWKLLKAIKKTVIKIPVDKHVFAI